MRSGGQTRFRGKRVLLLVLAFGLLGVTSAGLTGCGGNSSEAKVEAIEPGADQGRALADLFQELELKATWEIQGVDEGRRWSRRVASFPGPGNHFTQVRLKNAEGTEVGLWAQFPEKLHPPADGPLLNGYLTQADMRGGPSYSMSPLSKPGGGDVPPTPNQAELDLMTDVAEGICLKFAGRECGEPTQIVNP